MKLIVCQKYLLSRTFNFLHTGKPITFTLPVGGLQGAKTAGGQQLISMPQKGLTIGGKAVTVQLAPGTGGQKTVTILSSAAASGVQKTLTQADLPPGHKIVMIQPKRNDGSNVVTHKTISEPLNAYSTDMNLMDNNLDSGVGTEQHIEQMDGADDNIGLTTDAKETSEFTNENGSNSDDEEEVIGQIEPGVVGLIKKKVERKSKKIGVLSRHQPKFVKMGLFGGSPATPASNTAVTSASTTGTTSSDIDHNSEESTNPSQDESEFEAGNQESQNAQSNDHQALPTTDVNDPVSSNTGDQSENQTNERFDNEPTASETEAANILTIIKSGELLLSRNDETTPTSGTTTGQTNGDGNVTILFNNEPHTTKGSSVSASPVSSTNTKTIQKSVGFTSNTGHLDALASAALQASTNETN